MTPPPPVMRAAARSVTSAATIAVAATAAVAAPAPSATLLRFLRFQAGGPDDSSVFFFLPNLHCSAPFTPNLRHHAATASMATTRMKTTTTTTPWDAAPHSAPTVLRGLKNLPQNLQQSLQNSLQHNLRSTASHTAAAQHRATPPVIRTTLEAGLGLPVPSVAALATRARAVTSWILARSRRRSELTQQHGSQALRPYTTGDARPWMQRLADLTGPNGAKELAKQRGLLPDDLPSPISPQDPMGTIFGRTKAATELKLRCTEFDENGKVVLVNGEFKKSELIAKYGLQPRDLRKIDSSTLPSILVRPSSILVNLLHLRVLIQHNRVLIFDAWGSSNTYAQSMFMYDLEGKLGSKEGSAGFLPYEFRALEAVLVSVTSGLEGEFEGIREPVSRVLRELEEDIDRDKLRHLLVYSKKLGTFEQKARLVRDAVEALLEEDEDLSAMYLTEKAHDIQRDIEDHTEIEMLLESYHKVADEIVQGSGNLVTNIRNTEEIIRAILDANRNALMLLDLKFSIGTLGIGSGAFVAALYGMNLKNYMEESALGFGSITGLGVTLVVLVCVYGMHKLRRVQRMRMWGERGSSNRGSWRDLDSTAGLPGEKRAERMRRLKEERMAVWQSRREHAEDAHREHKALR